MVPGALRLHSSHALFGPMATARSWSCSSRHARVYSAGARIVGWSLTERCSREGPGPGRLLVHSSRRRRCGDSRSPRIPRQRTPPPGMAGDGDSPRREGDRNSAPWSWSLFQTVSEGQCPRNADHGAVVPQVHASIGATRVPMRHLTRRQDRSAPRSPPVRSAGYEPSGSRAPRPRRACG